MKRVILIVVLAGFSFLTAMAVLNHGYTGIFQYSMATYAGMQVLVDLVIALGIFLVWMWQDASANNRSPWPWLLVTLVAGSFGPLIYLLVYHSRSSAAA